MIWTYSAEGNAIVRFLVEPARRLVFKRLSKPVLLRISQLFTALLYLPVYSLYRMELLSFLPYFEYFRNFRRLSFGRNVLNVFDKLNAPQTIFTSLGKCHKWFSDTRFEPGSISIRPYAGVSYSLSGVKRAQ